MALRPADLVAYAAAAMPLDDVSPVGGVINPLVRVVFSEPQIVLGDSIEAISSSFFDLNITLTVTAMTTLGMIAIEHQLLNGVVPVDFVSIGAIHHLESCLLSGPAQGTVTIRRASDNAPVASIPPGELGFQRLFQQAVSAAQSPKTYWTKYFLANTNLVDGLAEGVVSLQPDAGGFITACLAAAVNDSGTAPNRITAPAATLLAPPGTFTTLSQAIPGGTLPPGGAIGVWVRMALLAANPPIASTFACTISGA